jgi:hypothetical protein
MLPEKLFLSSHKHELDPGSGQNGFQIPDPGVKNHWIPDPDPQHCIQP